MGIITTSRVARIVLLVTLFVGLGPQQGVGQPLSRPQASTATSTSPELEARFFPVGERLEYAISLGRIRLGHATMTVEGMERLNGVETYRTSLHIRIGAAMLNYEDRLVSWIEPEPFRSHAFVRRDPDDEDRLRHYHFDPASGRATSERQTSDGEVLERLDGPVEIPADVLDELAALYLLRTMSLDEGETRLLDQYFDPSVPPMELTALETKRTRVPAGRFEVTVYQAVMPALPAFQADHDPQIYVSNGEDRLIVLIETDTKIGRLRMYLTDYGVPAKA